MCAPFTEAAGLPISAATPFIAFIWGPSGKLRLLAKELDRSPKKCRVVRVSVLLALAHVMK